MISASALKRGCGYPRVLSKVEPTTAKDREARARRDAAADKGTMFHAAVELWAAGGQLPQVHDPEVQGWLELLAMTWEPRPEMLLELAMGLTADGLGVLCREPEPHVYEAIDGSPLITAGRADVVSTEMHRPSGAHVVVIRDWKTGKWPVDPPAMNLQATALALAAAALAGADGYRREIYYVRDGYLDADAEPIYLCSREHDQALAEVREAAALDDTPRPGPQCESCWERRMKRCTYAAVAA